MESLEVRRVRGTNDFVPPEEARLRRLTDALRSVFELYGYQGIETPILEDLDLFLRKSGEEIAARMYAFTHWNRQLCLRPEYTASVMRAYVNHLQDRPLPLRLYYAGPTFRYEKPQRGRYRQFTEVGVECIGGSGPAADAELLRLATRALETLGIRRYRVVIGHLGVVLQLLRQLGIDEHAQGLILGSMEPLARRTGDREAVIERIVNLAGYRRPEHDDRQLDPDGRDTALPSLLHEFGPRDATRVTSDLLQRANLSLDAGTRTPEEIVERLLTKAGQADLTVQVRTATAFIARLNELAGPPESALPALTELLSEQELDPSPLREMAAALELFNVQRGRAAEITVNLGLGRGLRYYTGLVFEIYHDEPEGPLQLCGGGRYDDLVRALGARESVPACGFSFGLERLDLARGPEVGADSSARVDVLMAPLQEADVPLAATLAEALRQAGMRVELDIKMRGAKGSLRHADREGIPLVALLGDQERARAQVVLRNMAVRQEETIRQTDLISAVSSALAEATSGVGPSDKLRAGSSDVDTVGIAGPPPPSATVPPSAGGRGGSG
jgi:histidyl-tRNA synthetase